ncbi:MAG: hypothetical protein H2069_03225 [Legionella sp.]|nr:hypothetical protein [Legionella sp.]
MIIHNHLRKFSISLQTIRTYILGSPTVCEKIFYLLFFLGLIVLRFPNILIHGRVWAEEGLAFLQQGFTLPWPEALFSSVGGYLNIVANLAGIIAAKLLPLEWARFVGPLTGLFFQGLTGAILLFSSFEWLQNRVSLLLALLLIAIAPLVDEVWLNSLHPQFHLTLCAALILAMPAPINKCIRLLHLVILLLAPFCGPTAWFLLPLFILRSLDEKLLYRLYQTLIIFIGVLLQYILFYKAADSGQADFNVWLMPFILLLKFVFIPFIPFYKISLKVASFFHILSLESSAAFYLFSIALMIIGLVFIGFILLHLWRRFPRSIFWLFCAGTLIAILSCAFPRGGSAHMLNLTAGNRYIFVPQVLFSLCLLGVTSCTKGRNSLIFGLLLSSTLLSGFNHFSNQFSVYSPHTNWIQEVHAWRDDHTHIIKIDPQGWTVRLP